MMPALHPWALGPFDLLTHAEEHLRQGEDFDRRMALITFDDALEVAITTYLQLHPEQRDGREYQSADVERWLQNYHTKLDFLESELETRGLQWKVERSHIIWLHRQRSEQYHGGSKGIPEKNDLDLIRECSHWVFEILFEVSDVEQIIGERLNEQSPSRNDTLDRAIDLNIGMIEIGNIAYYASEVLFSVDHAAYLLIGAELRESDNADGNSAA